MPEKFGPVELVAFAFPQLRVPDAVRAEVAHLVATDQVRIVDLVGVRRPDPSTIEVVELSDLSEELDFVEPQLKGAGLAGQEDIDQIASDLLPGTAAVILVLEHLWASGVADAVRASGGILLTSERIPAEVVTAVAELAELDHAELELDTHPQS
ncbi:DUF6325 family protein [Cellulomonas edaphi]|uniref:DUF6325 family protein n=1 Tax=Cellulomonas edaphi TaxID=3053468 RepID=A0ABT7S4A7_9CELL|nr:DUF6325 family protein [Cellulomons edaphi]MDM7830458.1 DUF6325 family protein [Cellulomons edaphi]